MARPVTIDHERVDEYVRINHEYETAFEMASFLKVSDPIVYESIKRQGLKPLKHEQTNRSCKITSYVNAPPHNKKKEPKYLNYLRENYEKKNQLEMATELGMSESQVFRVCKKYGLVRLIEVTQYDWPQLEEIEKSEEWHDALIRIMAAIFFEDGRSENEGCDDWENRKARMKAIRPKAIYDVQVQSSIVREYLEESGFHVKQ